MLDTGLITFRCPINNILYVDGGERIRGESRIEESAPENNNSEHGKVNWNER